MAILGPCDLGSSHFVLVTGGAGFIGHHLVRALLEAGHAVRVLDDLSTGARANLPSHPNLDFQRGSILDREAVATATRGAGSIVHLAGLVGMRLVSRRPALAYRTSVEGTRNLLRATRVPIAFFSSSAVYGIEANTDTRESLPIHRSAPLAYDGGRPGYSTGKWQMEKIAQDAAREGRRILVVRPFNVVGQGQRSDSGMVLPRFIELARRGEPLTVYGDGMQTRCFTEVGVFATTIVRLLRCSEDWRPASNVVNVGNATSNTILEIAEMVRAHAGGRVPIRFQAYEEVYPGKVDVRHRMPHTAQMERLVGRVAWPELRSIVRECWEKSVPAGIAARTASTTIGAQPCRF